MDRAAIDDWAGRQAPQPWLQRREVRNIAGFELPLFIIPQVVVPFFATTDPIGLSRVGLSASTPVGLGLQLRVGYTFLDSEFTVSVLGRYQRLWFSGVKVRDAPVNGDTQGGLLDAFGGGMEIRYTRFNVSRAQPYVGAQALATAWSASFLVNEAGAPETVQALMTFSLAGVLGLGIRLGPTVLLDLGMRVECLFPDELFGRGTVFTGLHVLMSPYVGLFMPILTGSP